MKQKIFIFGDSHISVFSQQEMSPEHIIIEKDNFL